MKTLFKAADPKPQLTISGARPAGALSERQVASMLHLTRWQVRRAEKSALHKIRTLLLPWLRPAEKPAQPLLHCRK